MAKTPPSLLEKIVVYLVLLLANLRALVFVFLFPDTSRPLSMAWVEILLWMLCAVGMVYLLHLNAQSSKYMELWRRNWLPAAFLGLALLSVLWSVAPLATLFRVLELFFSTVLAAYFGVRLLPERMMEILFWFGAVLFIVSIGLVYGAPPTGTMYWAPFHGAWRGVYWHRNHLASITAFLSTVYLCRLILGFQRRNAKAILDGIFYVLSLLVLYFTKSATGYIVFIVLNFSVLVILLWLCLYPQLKKKHYLLVLGLGTLVVILVLLNLNRVFGLFHRDTTMTGRVGLWNHLLNIAGERFWLGHGFGAVWMLDSFREFVRQQVGWASQPLIGDNGFMDIYLHLGIIGLLMLLGVIVLFAIRAIRYALVQKTLPAFFPLLVLIYALFANVSFSLFAETEVFVWFLIVAALFMTTPPTETPVT
jgi:exopolysaccharide production protein ExoQ